MGAGLMMGESACRKEEPPPEQVYNIPVRIVVVLRSGEQIGNPSNAGCRLTLAQIDSYLVALNKFAPEYGAKIVFQYDPPIEFGINGLPRTYPYTFWVRDVMNYGGVIQDTNWDETKINFYFTGNI